MGFAVIKLAAIAFASGALVVLSPCTLPVMPGLLAVVGKTHARSGSSGLAKAGPVLAFGLSVALGLAGVVALGSALSRGLPVTQPPWSIIPALLLAMAGLFTLGFGSSGQQSLVHRATTLGGRLVPVFTGLALGAAWTPCATPSLGLGLLAASQADSLPLGVAVLIGYVLGVMVPLAAVLIGALNLPPLRRAVQRVSRGLQLASGLILILCAALVATGVWNTLTAWALSLMA